MGGRGGDGGKKGEGKVGGMRRGEGTADSGGARGHMHPCLRGQSPQHMSGACNDIATARWHEHLHYLISNTMQRERSQHVSSFHTPADITTLLPAKSPMWACQDMLALSHDTQPPASPPRARSCVKLLNTSNLDYQDINLHNTVHALRIVMALPTEPRPAG